MSGIEPMNHLPFIVAAFGLGAVLIGGFFVWLYLDAKEIKSHLQALDQTQINHVNDHRGSRS